MSVNRSVWNTRFPRERFPGLPCPRCAPGKLKLVPATLAVLEPAYSVRQHNDEDFEPDWVEGRFAATMRCDEAQCGEFVNAIGDTKWVETYIDDEDGYVGPAIEEVLSPSAMFPAPSLFRITAKVPRTVADQLNLAFQLFWADIPSCVGRLRTAVEIMLNEHGVPDERLDKSKYKLVRMNLHDRIVAFEKMATGADAGESLQALRNIGNLGTHGTSVSKEALFDAADVLEDVLLGVYEKGSIKAKAVKLRSTQSGY